jgi:Family of unknown function (DUF5684)
MESSSAGSFMAVFVVVYIAIIAVMIVSMWKLFAKAGKPGWAYIIPIYNIIVMLEIVKRPTWWIILLFIPFVNAIVGIIIMIDFVKAFGKPASHFFLMLFFGIIYLPYLAFSDAKYVG